MSFFENATDKLKNTGLSELFQRPGSNEMQPMPKHLVLSSKCFIKFQYIDLASKENINVYVAEFDSFSKAIRLREKKNFKPYGFTKNMSLISADGWDLSFSGNKTDYSINGIIDIQERLLNGKSYSGLSDGRDASKAKLSFDIIEKVTYKDGLIEEYKYTDCSLISYSEDMPSNNQPVKFTIEFFCPAREMRLLREGSPNNNIGGRDVFVNNMINDILNLNKQ